MSPDSGQNTAEKIICGGIVENQEVHCSQTPSASGTPGN